MANELRFDDRVVLITGAGNGLGRAHALLFAARGAKVVVNDLGGSHTGEGQGQAAADKVVAEIEAEGGQAVASYDSVEEGAAIVKTAMDAYGRLDVLVNNAGILRDVTFAKMKDEDWDRVYRVHVRGAYAVTHAAWPIMREQRFGRVVMTASAAGIYGNFGQANYSMAKLGVLGFANTLALEGRKRNIFVNTIAPIAGSRMTETILPKELLAALKPELVSPLVAFLAHERCQENGGLFEVGGGFYAKLRWERAAGKLWRVGRTITPEAIADTFSTITSFEEATHPGQVMESLQPILSNAQQGPSKGGNQFIDVDEALGYEFPELTSSYDECDLSIYALGVGAGRDPLDPKDLQLVYEMAQGDGGFLALPSFGVIPALNVMMDQAKKGAKAPGLNYGFDRILHGEHYTEVMRPLPRKATLTHRIKIKDIFDKGKHALVVTEIKSYDEAGDELIRNELTMLVRGAGGWGGDRGPVADVQIPNRAPDKTTQEQIPADQALLYRLSGDWNPLHVDPNMAKAFGFERPILHGLCTFGYATRHVINGFCGGDPRYFKAIKVRFAESVFPGETLVTEMWKASDHRVLFTCRVKERDKVVISNAYVELYPEIPRPKPKRAPKREAPSEAPASAEPLSADVFSGMGKYIAQHGEMVGKVGTVYQFKLSSPDSVWTVDLKNGAGAVTAGETQKPECTLELSDADFMDMCTGKADPQKLYFGGKLKISGNVMASQKLEFLKKIDPQLVLDAARARVSVDGEGGDAPVAVAASSAPAEPAEPQAPRVFQALMARLEADPKRVSEVKADMVVTVNDPPSVWALSFKEGAEVKAGELASPDATLTLTEADLVALVKGTCSARDLFQRGKLRVDGDLRVAHRLAFFDGLL